MIGKSCIGGLEALSPKKQKSPEKVLPDPGSITRADATKTIDARVLAVVHIDIRRIFESISIYIIETEQRSASVAFVRENLCQIALKTQSEAAGILKTKPDGTASSYCRPPSTTTKQSALFKFSVLPPVPALAETCLTHWV